VTGNGYHNGHISLVDLVALHKELAEQMTSVFRTALETAGLIAGPMLEVSQGTSQAFATLRHGHRDPQIVL
jgi:hypothetical protein